MKAEAVNVWTSILALSVISLGLPTIPVFTGVTGAVSRWPSRPVEPSLGDPVHPVNVQPLMAVDGLRTTWACFIR